MFLFQYYVQENGVSMNDKKNLQCSPTGSYYMYFNKSVIEKAFHWQHMQQMEIE